MSTRNNKRQDRNRKPTDRRNHEERRPLVSPKSNRQKRWKDLYETGTLGADDLLLKEDDDPTVFEDEENV